MHWSLLLVSLGSALGGALRLGTYELMRQWIPARPELGTLAVNLLGCVLAGVMLAILEPRGLYRPGMSAWKALIVIGLLGGFTTFSAFSIETILLARDGLWGRAVAYVLISTLGGLAVATGSYLIVARL